MPDTLPDSSSAERRLTSARPAAGWRQWIWIRRRKLANLFSRQKILDQLSTLAWVVPLTILIWVYAEREQLTTQRIHFIADIRSVDSGGRIFTILEPADQILYVDLTGPQGRVDRLREEFTNHPDTPIVLNVDRSLAPGREYTLSELDQLLNKNGLFEDNGITVTNCTPPLLRVYVDEIQTVDVPVQAAPTDSTVDSAVFDPPLAHVRGPRSVLDKFRAQGRLRVVADLSTLPDLKTPGLHDVPDVKLSLGFHDDQVSLQPVAVRATVRIRQADVEYKIPSVPVFLVTPAGMLDKYKVVYNPILTNVTVIGLAEKINQLKQESFLPKPKATLEIDRDDTLHLGQSQLRRVNFELPDGVRVSPDDANREMEFKLLDRSATE